MFGLKKENRQYLVVVACCCLMMSGMIGGANMNGLFYDSMAQTLNATKTQTTLHVTLSQLASGFMTPVAAILYKKYGGKKIVLVGAVLYLLAGCGIAFSNNVYLNDVLGIFKGFGYCFANFLIITMTINNWFVKSRGKITGLVLCTSGIYGAIASPLISYFIEIFGYRISYFIFIAFTVLCLIPYILFCPFKPEDVGLKPFGEGEINVKKIKKTGNENYCLLSVIFLTLVILQITTQAMAGVGPHFSSYATNIGMSVGATMVSMSMIGNVTMKMTIGYLIDKIGAYKSVIIMMLVSSCSLIAILLTRNSIIMIIASLTYGAAFAANTVGMSSIVSETYTKDDYPNAYAGVNLIANLSNALTLTLVSMSYDKLGNFTKAFTVILILQVVGIACIVLVANKVKNTISINER